MRQVLIIGGGISGLAAAYFLSRRGIRPTLLEASSRLGGLIQTDFIQGCRLEAGPDSYISTKPAVAELAAEIPGLAARIIGSNDAARRIFVVRNGRLVPFPKGMSMMVPGEWRPALLSPLFSTRSKAGFVGEWFAKPRERLGDVSVADFVLDHFDRDLLDYVTEPLLSGVYGGSAGELSAESVLPRFVTYERKYGSLQRGVRAELSASAADKGSLFRSFDNGMQTLTDSLVEATAGAIDIVHAEAISVERASEGWRVKTADRVFNAGHVILACPAYRAAALVEHSADDLAAELAAIPYSSAILVMLVYAKSQFDHPLNGFGFLVPRPERHTVAACTWINTKFPSRMRDDLVAIRGFIVDRDAERLRNASDEELVTLVRDDYRRLMGVSATAVFHTVHRWPRSMPQYVVGHAARAERIQDSVDRHTGLYLVGNAYEGVGIPDCVRIAKKVAARIAAARIEE